MHNVPQTLVQPDGQILECLASGDEYYHWLHDKDGYVIIRDAATGYFVYAREINGDLVPTDYVPGRIDPAQAGLKKNARSRHCGTRDQFRMATASSIVGSGYMPATGSVNNIVIFIRFHDEPEYTESVSTFDAMFNSTTSGANSLVNYFSEVSNAQLSVTSSFYPVSQTGTVASYRDPYDRNYYMPYNAATNPSGYTSVIEAKQRLDAMLKRAVDSISAQVPVDLDIDINGDGYVDNVVFVVSGPPAGWGDMLWPHTWVLIFETPVIGGKQVYTYNLQLSDWLVGGGNPAVAGIGVLCHEMCHSIGMPDLYHYYRCLDLQPVGPWDIMEDTANPPQGVDAYLQWRYTGWIDTLPVITSPGTYSLNPLASTGDRCYKIPSQTSTVEYYVVEYRRKTGTFENSLPGAGLLVYRINEMMDGQGNSDGPPDEVYLFRPGGARVANGDIASANLSSDVGRTEINDSTDPASFLSDGSPGGLNISDIGSAEDTISFCVDPLNQPPGIVPSQKVVTIPEGGAASFGVMLNRRPTTDVSVTVSLLSGGDPDISLTSGSSLTFTAENWAYQQMVTLAAAQDPDAINGTATVSLTAEGYTKKEVTARESDHDRQLRVSTSPITGVSIGGTLHGVTDYSRIAGVTTLVTLKAPDSVLSSRITYVFYHWVINGIAHNAGEREINIGLMSNTTATAVYRQLKSVTISGPAQVYENSRAGYRATAYFTHGPSKHVSLLSKWRETSPHARFCGWAILQTGSVSSNKTCWVYATYAGVTAGYKVTILNR